MDKKDEKTFADLFSSSTADINNENQKNNDIENNNIELENKNEEITNKITFDNLFGSLEKEESNKSKIEQKMFSTQEDIKNIEEESKLDINAIFESNSKSEEETKNFEQEHIEEDINPFMEFNLESENIENSNLTNDNIPEENPFLFNDNINEEQNKANLFFDSKSEEEINDNNIEVTKKENDSNNDINLFFTPEQQEIASNINNEQNIEQKNESEDTNPFFQKEKKEEAEEVDKTSNSPFFQDEIKEENNPLFNNQLNLIENKQHDSSNKTSIDVSNARHFNVKIEKQKEPLIKVILGVLSYALFIWLLLIGVTLFAYVLDIKIRAAKGDYSAPKFNAYVVLTGSMLPEIKVYDVVVTKKVEAKTLKEGDIITFASADSRFEGTIITHRIIKKNPSNGTEGYTFQTRGDNNNVADNALVPEKNIYGKVILKIPKLGYLQEFLAKDGGWIIVILIPCLVVISYDIVKLGKGLKKRKYKNIKVQK